MTFLRKLSCCLLFLGLFGFNLSSALSQDLTNLVLDQKSDEAKEYDRLRTAQAAPVKVQVPYDPIVQAPYVLSISDGTLKFQAKSQANKILRIRLELEKKAQAKLKQKSGSVETSSLSFKIFATDFNVDQEKDEGRFCLMKVDNRDSEVFKGFSGKMNFVVGSRVLCHCMKDEKATTCGGLKLGKEEGFKEAIHFFRNAVSALNPEDPMAQALFDGEHRHPLGQKKEKSFTRKIGLPQEAWDKELEAIEKLSLENIQIVARQLTVEFPTLEFQMIYFNYPVEKSDGELTGETIQVFQGLRVKTKSANTSEESSTSSTELSNI